MSKALAICRRKGFLIISGPHTAEESLGSDGSGLAAPETIAEGGTEGWAEVGNEILWFLVR